MKVLSIIYLCFLFVLTSKELYSRELTQLDLLESKLNTSINLNNIDVNLIEQSVIYYSNKYRSQNRKHELIFNEKLQKAAYLHSTQMVNYDFFSHINKQNSSLKDIADRVEFAGYIDYETISENIFYGYIDTQNIGTYKDLAIFIVKSFIESKGHKENLLATDIEELGCGIAFEQKLKNGYLYFYFTQNFGKRF